MGVLVVQPGLDQIGVHVGHEAGQVDLAVFFLPLQRHELVLPNPKLRALFVLGTPLVLGEFVVSAQPIAVVVGQQQGSVISRRQHEPVI